MNCVVYILGVVLRSTILYLEYTFRSKNEQIHVQSVKIVILECHEFSSLLTGLDAFV